MGVFYYYEVVALVAVLVLVTVVTLVLELDNDEELEPVEELDEEDPVEELLEDLLDDDGDAVLDEELAVTVTVGMLIDGLLLDLLDEELVDGTVRTKVDVLSERLVKDVLLDVLDVSRKGTDVVVKDVVLDVLVV